MKFSATTSDCPRVTAAQMKRIARTWSEYAKEAIEVHPDVLGSAIGSVITVFGSELAMLRLHYRMKVGRVEFSSNLGKWYYVNK
jgi:hypothetical protein